MSCALSSPASSPESSSADFSLPASPTFMYRMTSRSSIYGMEIVHEEQRQLINRLGSHVIYSRCFCEVMYTSVWFTLLTCDLTWYYMWNFPYHNLLYKVGSLVDTSWSVHSLGHIFVGWVDRWIWFLTSAHRMFCDNQIGQTNSLSDLPFFSTVKSQKYLHPCHWERSLQVV